MISNKIKIVVAFVFLILGTITLVFYYNKDKSSVASTFKPSQILDYFKISKTVLNDAVIVKTDFNLKKANSISGEVSEVNEIEKRDFSKFSGLENQKGYSKDSVIFSKDKTQVILPFFKIGTSEVEKEFVCDLEQKKCNPSNLLTKNYQGVELNDRENIITWTSWDSVRNMLAGKIESNDGTSFSVFVCDADEAICQKTENFSDSDSIQRILPNNFMSPSLKKFVIFRQREISLDNVSEKRWEIGVFSKDDFENPERIYDISSAIDRNEKYENGVYSISWDKSEKYLALGTKHKIFLLDLSKNSLYLIYEIPLFKSGNPGWNFKRVFLSPDGQYIVFVDKERNPSNDSQNFVGILKRVSIQDNNSVNELMREFNLKFAF